MTQEEPPKVGLKDNHGTLQVAATIVNHCTACAEREAAQQRSDRFFRWIFPLTTFMSWWLIESLRPDFDVPQSRLADTLSNTLLIGGILLSAVGTLGTAMTWWRWFKRYRKRKQT